MKFLAQIESFLTHCDIVTLVESDSGDDITKCGLLPFRIENGELHIYVMQPRSRKPRLGPPEFQICKGTRRFWNGTHWQDLKKKIEADTKEALVVTALREAQEEIGLRLEPISHLCDAGEMVFASASSGKDRRMRLFLAEMRERDGFHPIGPDHPDTAHAAWQTLNVFRTMGREDHVRIVEQVVTLLKNTHDNLVSI